MKGSEVPMRIGGGGGGTEEIQNPDGDSNEGVEADLQSSGCMSKKRF